MIGRDIFRKGNAVEKREDEDRELAQSPEYPETAGRFYTLQEAAEMLGIPVRVIRADVERGKLPTTHHYARHLISATDLRGYYRRLRRHALLKMGL